MKNDSLKLSYIFGLFILTSLLYNCSKNDDGPTENPEPTTLNDEVHDFVWSGLNEIYLWKDEVPNLADTKNDDQDAYFTFLNGYTSPETLFDALLYQKGTVDKFSFIVDDYVALENSFQGTSLSNGLDFGLVRLSNSDDIFGYVRYVANNSDAATKNIARGEFFLEVNGQQLTLNNYQDLLFGSNTSYTLGMASITNGSIATNGKTVALTKSEFTENPILINKVIETSGSKIGYLMYNSFIANFDQELNAAILDLKTSGITDLVLDLRYNPGGRVSSAIALSSMITGQFNGEIFSREIWNDRYQNFFLQNAPDRLINRFTDKLLDDTPINTLNLNKVYILTTSNSASASELVINGLNAYINVVQIGTNTTGKYTGSVTLYDSENFGKDGANPNHTYALQPLVLKIANANGFTDYNDGLVPDHVITYNTSSGTAEGENLLDLGILGDETEPFLAKAIELITGSTTKRNQTKSSGYTLPQVEFLNNSKDFSPIGREMYIGDFNKINP